MISKYKVLVQGKNLSYFLSLVISKHIVLYDLNQSHDRVIFVVDEKGYQKLLDIKTSCSITVLNRYGIAKIIYLVKKYFVFLLGLLFFFLVLFLLQNIIFDVKVIHSSKEIQNLLYQDLEEFGIKKFHFKVSYEEKEEIVSKILEKETDKVEWLEIEEVGVSYVIRVEERKKNKEKTTCNFQNIVAKKDARIIDIDAEEGEVVKKELDYVEKGEVIISGVIHNKEDIVSKRCAKGKVYGEVWYQVHLDIPKYYHEEKIKGEEKHTLKIEFLNYSYALFSSGSTYQVKKVPLLASRILPISISFVTYRDTVVTDKEYTLDTIDEYSFFLAEEKLKQQISSSSEIMSKKILKKYEKDSKIIVEVFFKVKEDITDISTVDTSTEEQEKQKEE